MNDQNRDSTRRRRLILLAALTLGVAGGAAADAVLTLQSGNAGVALEPAGRALTRQAVSLAALEPDAGVLPAADACSCVEGAAVGEDRSPLTSSRSKTHRTHHAAPMHVDLCAAVAALEQ